MKQNPNKLADLNEKKQAAENQKNIPYLMKKRKESEQVPSKDLSKQQKIGNKDEEDKNKKTTKSLRFRHYKEFVFLYRHQIEYQHRASQVPSYPKPDERSDKSIVKPQHGSV